MLALCDNILPTQCMYLVLKKFFFVFYNFPVEFCIIRSTVQIAGQFLRLTSIV